MNDKSKYNIDPEIKFGYTELIDIPELIRSCTDKWTNHTLCQVNESVVRLGVVQGEFHWHKHDDEDEYFLVLDGELLLDLEGDKSYKLVKHQCITVPMGVTHRTRAKKRTAILMIERKGVKATGD